MKVSKRPLLTLVLLCLFFSSGILPTNAQKANSSINTIVIDAGHGGQDAGCSYKQYREKDIALNVALRLGTLIQENYPQVKVVYTRERDVFIPLNERGNIANKADADLFFSIHVNAAKSSTASGTETFVMGVSKAEENLDIAMKENDVITYEDDYSTKYQGYVPGSSESLIIFSLMQYSYQGQSLTLANAVQRQYVRNLPMGNRGVKQAGFLVLWKTAMPSILTELGFLSNASDRALLTSQEGQEKLARSLFNALSEYKAKADGSSTWTVLDAKSPSPSLPEKNPGENSEHAEERPLAEQPSQVASSTQVNYRIQIMTSDRKIPKNSYLFGAYRGEVTEIVTGGIYKYYVENTVSYKEALSLQTKVRQTFRDAFVVPFRGEKRISLEEAQRK